MNRLRTSGPRASLFAVLLTGMGALSASAARDTPVDPDDRDYLRRQYSWFQSLPAGRQQQLRTLNEEFHRLDPEAQARLKRVMQNYNAWLVKLPDADRDRVLAAATADERLKLVADLREQDWVRALPKVQREEYAALPAEARPARVREWRTEEDARHDDWAIAQKNWDDFKQGKLPPGLTVELRTQLEAFAVNLRPSLADGEKKALDEAKAAADEHGQFMWYAIEVVRLADAHPLLPGRVGPKDFASLPESVREYLAKNDRGPRKKGPFPFLVMDDKKLLTRAEGRWPEYAVELTRHAERNNLKLPVPLGDSTKAQMPPEVQAFIDKVLEPTLKQTEKGRDQLANLTRVQGRWPEYPRQLMDLARMYRLPVPNWTLPGQPQMWDRFRVNRMKPPR